MKKVNSSSIQEQLNLDYKQQTSRTKLNGEMLLAWHNKSRKTQDTKHWKPQPNSSKTRCHNLSRMMIENLGLQRQTRESWDLT